MPEPDARSPKPGMPLWLILITLMGGAFLFQRGTNQPQDKSPTAAAEAQERTAPRGTTLDERMLDPLRAFLGIRGSGVPVDSTQATELLKLDRPLPGGSRLKASAEWVSRSPIDKLDDQPSELEDRIGKHVGLLEFLVVTVADPIDTATNLRFDLQLDALHKALGTDSYVLDRYYLPWESPQKGLHRTEPGVLLYRRNGPSEKQCQEWQGERAQQEQQIRTDLLLVYVVGETPTGGIHKDAFLEAVKQVKTLSKLAICQAPAAPLTIHVAGLLFTGAADSLALAIRQAHEQDPQVQFRVITGGAISVDRARFTQLAGPGLLEFHATVLSGRILREALIEHVRERAPWKRKVRIAWLTETGTGYGSSIAIGRRDGSDQQNGQRKTATAVVPSKSSTGKAADPVDNGAYAEIIEFTFPVNIAKVRAGYAESRRRERSGQLTLGPETSRLPIPFDDTHTARDIPPMQTPKVTAPTAELILGQILTAIRNQGIRYVGISSSDPRDPIFLAELIYEQCPGVQIMLVSSDLLYTHSEYRSIMHGTLVASPYPLHPQASALCFPFGEPRARNSRSTVLASPSNYGLYNAVLLLRGLARGRFHYDCQSGTEGQPDVSALSVECSDGAMPRAWPLGYSMPLEKEVAGRLLRPPVWISRISSAGIYPITVRQSDLIEASDDEDTRDWKKEAIPYTLGLKIPGTAPNFDLPRRRVPSREPPSVYIANLVWLVLAVLYCLAPWFPKLIGKWARPLIAGQTRDFRGLMLIFRALITGAFLYVLTMFGGLSFVLLRWVDEQGLADVWFPLVQLCLCAVVGLALVGLLLNDVLRAGGGLALDVWRVTALPRRSMAWGWDHFLAALGRIVAYRKRGRATLGAPASTVVSSSDSAPAASPVNWDWSWRLIMARSIGLAVLLGLAIAHISSSVMQRSEWEHVHPEDAFLWFMLTSDVWNGLSPAMTGQLLSASLILLAFGMLDQMHMLREHTAVAPDASASARRIRQMRRALVFPLINRLDRGAPVVLYGLFVAATLLWLFFVFWQMQIPDHFVRPLNFPIMLLFFVGGFWCVRLCKWVLILNDLRRQLEVMTSALKKRWPDEWPNIFALLSEKPVGLHELFWAHQPKKDDEELKVAQEELTSKEPLREIRPNDTGLRKAEQRLRAVEIYRYVRQAFRHIVRLGLGLAVSACLLFLITQNFPFSREPLLRLSASIMLASVGCVMAWYYLKFDRNELLSHLVGTDPKRISLNWSLFQMVAPAILLTAVALVSQAFPEIWQWLRSVLEPMARSSI